MLSLLRRGGRGGCSLCCTDAREQVSHCHLGGCLRHGYLNASDVYPETSLRNFTVLHSLRDGGPAETVGAAEAVVNLCAKTYDLASTSSRRPSRASRPRWRRGRWRCGARRDGIRPQRLVRAPARYLAALRYGAENLESRGRSNVSRKTVINESIANITKNIARSLSNRISKDATNVTDEALAAETFVKVRWPWLAFTSSQAALSVVLLATAIAGTKRAVLGVLKSCTLQAFVAINARDKQALEISLAQQRHQREVDHGVERGPEIALRLGMTDSGWKLGLEPGGERPSVPWGKHARQLGAETRL
ncbi:hypothetical protein LX32DRAFT_697426 [Colletotrichum zoysiae]|uniref:Uncharacterized protein n=1 Tax=Colletotrichum zoysiae TaxID=1216348 RepID=A0AAD9H8D4_9PEZI|nr:hypothetical protein LX32DRAFT_697426 [Colletotrichum zoysiae]